jgi:hypothetical protein
VSWFRREVSLLQQFAFSGEVVLVAILITQSTLNFRVHVLIFLHYNACLFMEIKQLNIIFDTAIPRGHGSIMAFEGYRKRDQRY